MGHMSAWLSLAESRHNHILLFGLHTMMKPLHHSAISSTPTGCPIDNRYIEDGFLTQYCLDEFNEVREEEVLKLLTTASAKSCELDPFPSNLLVRHRLEVIPIITRIANASLTYGELTSELKTALIHPLLKKPGIDCIFRNYRPICNLPFLSKLIERIVCNQITQYTGTTGMAEKFQSACRAFIPLKQHLLKLRMTF